jgi:hypothetical protein
MRLISLVILTAAAMLPVSAQQPTDTTKLPPAVRLPQSREIALAKSAAPASVADSAEIWVLGDGAYVKAVNGTNGFGCIVQRALSGQSLIPRCDDASGVASLFDVYQLIERLRNEGRTYGEARRAIADGFASGKLKKPQFGGLSYMYSVDAYFATPNGQRVAFTPHVMIYWPDCNVKQLGMSASKEMAGTGLGFIDYGTPECTLVINTPPATARRAEEKGPHHE